MQWFYWKLIPVGTLLGFNLVRQVLGERPDELQRSALQIALRGVYLYVADAGKGRRLTSKN